MFGKAPSEEMLNQGIADHYFTNRKKILDAPGVDARAVAAQQAAKGFALPTFASVYAKRFIADPGLHEEVFGPFSMLVICQDSDEMLAVANALTGQLTCTIHGTDEEISSYTKLSEILTRKCGRLVRNGVPTGVQVAWAMHHGGPYPACSDSRFTAVGPDNLKRFSRPICYQNWHEPLLPPELRNSNPLGIWRTVNGMLTKDPLP
jgi:NADP-dependent aldehyde dehydrogenase